MTDSFGPVANSLDEYLDSLIVDEDLAEIGGTDRDPDFEDVSAAWLDSGFPEWRTHPWADNRPE